MRNLTTDELRRETLHRLALRRRRQPTRLDHDLVDLIADMIELSRERVPDCYEQATGARDSFVVGTPTPRCPRCGGRCGGDCG